MQQPKRREEKGRRENSKEKLCVQIQKLYPRYSKLNCKEKDKEKGMYIYMHEVKIQRIEKGGMGTR